MPAINSAHSHCTSCAPGCSGLACEEGGADEQHRARQIRAKREAQERQRRAAQRQERARARERGGHNPHNYGSGGGAARPGRTAAGKARPKFMRKAFERQIENQRT